MTLGATPIALATSLCFSRRYLLSIESASGSPSNGFI